MPKKNTYIYVVVDTVNINKENRNKMVDFSDNRGDSYSGNDPSKFVSKVNADKNIIWCGIVKEAAGNPTHRVAIKKIARKVNTTGPIILHKNIYYEQGDCGVAVGKVKSKKVSGEEDYYIIIEVSKGSSKIEHEIDPKMRMT